MLTNPSMDRYRELKLPLAYVKKSWRRTLYTCIYVKIEYWECELKLETVVMVKFCHTCQNTHRHTHAFVYKEC